MTDLPSSRAATLRARSFAETARTNVDAAAARLVQRASSLDRLPAPARHRTLAGKDPPPLFRCELALWGDTIVARLCGELDRTALGALDETFAQIVGFAPASVVVDLSELQFLDSCGLNALLRLRAELAPGIGLQLVRGRACVDRVFSASELDGVFDLIGASPQPPCA